MMHPDLATLLANDIDKSRPNGSRPRFFSRRSEKAQDNRGR